MFHAPNRLPALNRRTLLRVGGLGMLGLNLPGLLKADEQRQAAPRARARSVIFLHQWGGVSHHDTLDMKLDAPAEIRGEFEPIDTALPGIPCCEHLPRLAQSLDKVTLVRTLCHRMRNHNSAGYYSLTGHAPPTDDQRLRDTPELFPAYGSVVDRLAPSPARMPTFVAFPYEIRDGSVTPGQRAGFLGKQHDPLYVGSDPNDPSFSLPELSLPGDVTLDRLENRRELSRLIDRQASLLEFSPLARGIDAAHDKALQMLASPAVRQAFDLSEEPDDLREQYGRSTFGQSCLLARRLVEAGARFVNVYFHRSIGGDEGGWDTHDTNFPKLKNWHLPITDRALPTLLDDLESRGLLDETLVVWTGEFGRTPKINNKAGRDHWPLCYTALLAGGGVRRGFVFGESDRNGAYPARDPVKPDDLAATLYHLLGIDPHTEVYDALNRPLAIAAGSPVTELYA